MSEKVQITEVKVKIGDLDITLSIDQARGLKQALDELFPTERAIQPINIQPIWIEPYHNRRYYPYWETEVVWSQPDNSGTYQLQLKEQS